MSVCTTASHAQVIPVLSPCFLWHPYIPHFFNSQNFFLLVEPKNQAAIHREPAKLMEPREPAELMEPREPAELLEPREPAKLTEPREPAELTEPIENQQN